MAPRKTAATRTSSTKAAVLNSTSSSAGKVTPPSKKVTTQTRGVKATPAKATPAKATPAKVTAAQSRKASAKAPTKGATATGKAARAATARGSRSAKKVISAEFVDSEAEEGEVEEGDEGDVGEEESIEEQTAETLSMCLPPVPMFEFSSDEELEPDTSTVAGTEDEDEVEIPVLWQDVEITPKPRAMPSGRVKYRLVKVLLPRTKLCSKPKGSALKNRVPTPAAKRGKRAKEEDYNTLDEEGCAVGRNPPCQRRPQKQMTTKSFRPEMRQSHCDDIMSYMREDIASGGVRQRGEGRVERTAARILALDLLITEDELDWCIEPDTKGYVLAIRQGSSKYTKLKHRDRLMPPQSRDIPLVLGGKGMASSERLLLGGVPTEDPQHPIGSGVWSGSLSST
ncbi:hypothetical protein L227DRAFT_568595 [Lentinus tigrinus ALCF2SS1-6]|uniref:Uncharacterized protein n=1 Tax=Lentinus tigrinus ALCF2SS1-6 TaxID=1328759 RepID=A0A5C2RMM8_9APHY|nr:hypothetical protein L227DRAFT_568595 [Lentinus tigrinus ALCF2SS1-6]